MRTRKKPKEWSESEKIYVCRFRNIYGEGRIKNILELSVGIQRGTREIRAKLKELDANGQSEKYYKLYDDVMEGIIEWDIPG